MTAHAKDWRAYTSRRGTVLALTGDSVHACPCGDREFDAICVHAERLAMRMTSERVVDLDDSGLVASFRAGDPGAGTALVERHFDGLYRFFRSKVAGDVDDLVQQTFMSCLEARAGFRGECSFRTLLFRIARRRLHDHYRKKRRDQALDFTTTSVRALGTSPSAALQRSDAIAAVRAALQELSVDAQTLLELSYWQDMSTHELAEVFEVPVGTIKSRQFAARAALQALLSARGYELRDGALSVRRAGPVRRT
jgi:RNA polymerase sigma factor (sigma-70 family)